MFGISRNGMGLKRLIFCKCCNTVYCFERNTEPDECPSCSYRKGLQINFEEILGKEKKKKEKWYEALD
jgi:hypothetical protein